MGFVCPEKWSLKLKLPDDTQLIGQYKKFSAGAAIVVTNFSFAALQVIRGPLQKITDSCGCRLILFAPTYVLANTFG